ncbi:unnamed protein product, partial [Prorocentrum cordatum]
MAWGRVAALAPLALLDVAPSGQVACYLEVASRGAGRELLSRAHEILSIVLDDGSVDQCAVVAAEALAVGCDAELGLTCRAAGKVGLWGAGSASTKAHRARAATLALAVATFARLPEARKVGAVGALDQSTARNWLKLVEEFDSMAAEGIDVKFSRGSGASAGAGALGAAVLPPGLAGAVGQARDLQKTAFSKAPSRPRMGPKPKPIGAPRHPTSPPRRRRPAAEMEDAVSNGLRQGASPRLGVAGREPQAGKQVMCLSRAPSDASTDDVKFALGRCGPLGCIGWLLGARWKREGAALVEFCGPTAGAAAARAQREIDERRVFWEGRGDPRVRLRGASEPRWSSAADPSPGGWRCHLGEQGCVGGARNAGLRRWRCPSCRRSMCDNCHMLPVSSCDEYSGEAPASLEEACASGFCGGSANGAAEFDLSFPVEVEDGRRLVINWNFEDDPEQVAATFSLQHGFLPDEVPSIVKFVRHAAAMAQAEREALSQATAEAPPPAAPELPQRPPGEA